MDEHRRQFTYLLGFLSLQRATVDGGVGGIGGEGGIRTQQDSLDSVSCRFHIADIPANASVAVAPCTLLHAGQSRPFSAISQDRAFYLRPRYAGFACLT